MGFGQPSRRARLRLGGGDGIPRRREYYYSLYVTVAVEVLLLGFLLVFFVMSTRIMSAGFKNVSQAWRIALPAAVAVIVAIVGYQIVKSIKEIVRFGRERRDSRRTGSLPGTGRH